MSSFALKVALLSVMLGVVGADVQDHLVPNFIPDPATCPGGCATWATATSDPVEQARLNSFWADGKPPADAKNTCAMPAASAGYDLGDGVYNDLIFNSFAGPWCYCAKPIDTAPRIQYCKPDPARPSYVEQLNLQVAAEGIIVASFVTRDPEGVQGAVGEFGKSKDNSIVVGGVSFFYETVSKSENLNYTLHFVKFAGLEAGEEYTYRVKSGSDTNLWSEWHKFRVPRSSKVPTRIAIYGDMGHSWHNPMQNLKKDCEAGIIDTIVHMGDHAYDLGGADDKRGDAYMSVFSPTLSSCPWVPVIGNHEASDGDHFKRYLNMTWGEAMGKEDNEPKSVFRSTAESKLGELLTRTTFLGAGIHTGYQGNGGVPSNTSRYFSVNVGKLHIAALDLNNFDSNQSAWLEADLKSVQRDTTPWTIVTSHFPLVHPGGVNVKSTASASFYRGEASESWATSGHSYKPATCDENGECEQTVGEMMKLLQSSLAEILNLYNVDIYIAGHVHDYASMWPMCYNKDAAELEICKDASGSPIQSYDMPKGTVHITDGNGGVPGCNGTVALHSNSSICAQDPNTCRNWMVGCAHGRIIAHDSHKLTYEHVSNMEGKVYDTFTISK